MQSMYICESMGEHLQNCESRTERVQPVALMGLSMPTGNTLWGVKFTGRVCLFLVSQTDGPDRVILDSAQMNEVSNSK